MVKPAFCLLFHSIAILSAVAQQRLVGIPLQADSLDQVISLTSKVDKKNHTIQLRWNRIGKSGFYIVERSSDLKAFDVIAVLKAGTLYNNFEFIDERPAATTNYYRIKMQDLEDSIFYSNTTTVGTTDSIFCKFYPNPVDKLLVLKSDYAATLTITDLTGKIRIAQKLKPGLQVIDVSTMEKGIYVVTIFHEESNQVITKKLIKN